jgi:hypothetical protein
MIFRFWFESIFGFICLICILLLGAKGASSLVIFVLLPILMRIKKTKQPDERELQLFYKIGNLTMGLTILALIIIHTLQNTEINGHVIGTNWMTLAIASTMLAHGLAGLIIFKRQ